MKIKNLKSIALVLLCTVLNINYAWGTEVTVSWAPANNSALGSTIASVDGTATGTITTTNGVNSYDWNYTRTLVSLKSGKSDYVSFSSPDLQLGSSNAGETLNFTTSAIPGTIKSVTVGCWSKNGNHTLSITVGGDSYYSGATPSATGNTKSGSGTSTGTISIDFSIASNNALYISSIEVVYETGGASTFTVSYDANGGTGSMSSHTGITSGSSQTLTANTFTKDGYSFAGWNTAADGSGTPYADGATIASVTTNITLYAQWTYAVTLHYKGTTAVISGQTGTYTLPTTGTYVENACDAWKFHCWANASYTNSTTAPSSTKITEVTGPCDVYAVYKNTEDGDEATFTGVSSGGWTTTADSQTGTKGTSPTFTIATSSGLADTGSDHLRVYKNQTFTVSVSSGNITSISMTGVSGYSVSNFGSPSGLSTSGDDGEWTGSANSVTFTASVAQVRMSEVVVRTGTAYYRSDAQCNPIAQIVGTPWVTSTKDETVKIEVPVSATNFDANCTLSDPTVSGAGFAFVGWGAGGKNVTADTELETSIILSYTPSAYGTSVVPTNTATVTLGSNYSGGKTPDYPAGTVNGRSLPQEFLIIAKNDNKWWAVPANMPTSASTFAGVEVTPDNTTTPTTVPAGPATALYSLTDVHTDNYATDGQYVRFFSAQTNRMLWASTSGTGIKNDALYTGTSKSKSYEWNATTTNGQIYTLTNVGNENPDYALKYNDGQDRFGYYELGNASLYIVPVGCANRAALTSKDSTYNSITLAWDGAEGQSYNVYVQYSGSTEKSALLATSPCTITDLAHDNSEYTYIITPGAIDDACKLEGTIHTKVAPINITLSCDGTEYDLGPQDNPYTLPTTGEYVADPCDGWEFLGWSASEVTAGDSYTLIPTATTSGTYYAVYGGSRDNDATTFEKATSLSQLEEGMAVVIRNNYASNPYFLTSNNETEQTLTADGSKVTVNDNKYKWILGKSGDNWTFTADKGTGSTLGVTSTSNSTPVSGTATNSTWTITQLTGTYSECFAIANTTGTNIHLEYSSGFVVYSTTTDSWRAMQIYIPVSTTSSTSDCCAEVEVPNVSVATRTTSATISWDKQVAATNGYNLTIPSVSVDEDLPTNTTSYVIEGLQEATEYAYTLTANGPTCSRSFSGVISTDTLTISIAEWDTCGVYLDLGDMNGATAILENQNTQATVSVNYADSIFFSKYFEADSENKLLAIYNGTKDTINLSNYCLKRSELNQSEKTMELGSYGRIKSGYICPNEEIIFIRYANTAANSAEECASSQEGYDNWYIFGNSADGTFLNFSGPMSIGLYSKRASKFIDVIGASTNASGTGSLCQINASNHVTCAAATQSFNDMAGFYTLEGDQHGTEVVETDYGLSTNRCLLIRKNTVKSGMDAVEENVYATQQDCSSGIAEAFTTLSSEWAGLQIGSGTSSGSTHSKTCEGMGYVGGFDYNQYYSKFDTIPYTENFMDKRQPDGTYFVHIPGLDTMSCTNLRISVVDTISKSPLELKKVTGTWKVPIMVWKDTATTSTLFTKEAEDCAECDVIVMRDANLNVVAGGKNTIRDIEVYHSGQLNIPGSQTFNVRRLIMRSKEDTVPRADIQGALSQSQTTFAFDKRMKAGRWYKIALPYRCKISEVTYRNGELAHYGKDWYLQTYDGDNRANGIQTGNWHIYTDEYMEPGIGYNLAIDGDILEEGNSYAELRFPMTANTNFAENATVPVGVNAWGANNSRTKGGDPVTPNHLGWNMIGNPYMLDYTTTSVTTPLTIGKLEPDGITWTLNNNGLRYVVALKSTRDSYEQIAIGAGKKEMEPFMAYFVQIDGSTDREALNITFAKGQQHGRSIVRRSRAQYEEEDTTPVWCAVNITNPLNEKDETTLLISDDFTEDYDMMNDFTKMRGDKYKEYSKPVLASRNTTGDMAFNAVPDSTAAKGVPLTFYTNQAGQFTFRMDFTYGLDKIQRVEIYDDNDKQWHSLMNGDEYSFYSDHLGDNTDRFRMRVVVDRKAPQITTDLEPTESENSAPSKLLINGHVYIFRGGKIYDITGKQLR